MIRAPAMAALAVLLAAGCRHPTQVGPNAPGKPEAKQGEPSAAQKGVPPKGEHPRVPSSPKALLSEGEVGKLQDALSRRGYLEKHREGELDDATSLAIRKFQQDQGLAETGFPDRLTLQKLGIDPEKAYGKVSEESAQEKERSGAEGEGK